MRPTHGLAGTSSVPVQYGGFGTGYDKRALNADSHADDRTLAALHQRDDWRCERLMSRLALAGRELDLARQAAALKRERLDRLARDQRTLSTAIHPGLLQQNLAWFCAAGQQLSGMDDGIAALQDRYRSLMRECLRHFQQRELLEGLLSKRFSQRRQSAMLALALAADEEWRMQRARSNSVAMAEPEREQCPPSFAFGRNA